MIENIDYNLDELGRMVFTETSHLKLGSCYGHECTHCPWQDICKDERPKKPN
ncbi:MAG: hypothetical protein IPP60_15405 [Sphingobacteriales bacterium]|nr:hypothetical protein [Sphingobacteriales bacterium]